MLFNYFFCSTREKSVAFDLTLTIMNNKFTSYSNKSDINTGFLPRMCMLLNLNGAYEYPF
jgi:hypothetical protein